MVTASTPIVLKCSSGSMTVTPDQKGVGDWCQVHLIVSGESRPLGAERLSYVATHITSFLADPLPGQRWVLSLSERHTSAYGEHVAGNTIIRFQDADAKWFAEFVLTQPERSQWVQEMSKHTVA